MKKNENSKEIKFTDTNNPKRITFFNRFKRAIFNVETYGEFLLEKTMNGDLLITMGAGDILKVGETLLNH